MSTSNSMKSRNLQVQIPSLMSSNHLLLPLIDFNWHYQSVVSPTASPALLSPGGPGRKMILFAGEESGKGKARLPEESDEDDTDEFNMMRDEFFQVFKAFDENDDGLISKEEVRKLMSKLGHNMSDSDLELLMLTVDLNGDGCVDFDEFHAVFKKLEANSDMSGDEGTDEEEEENLKEAFRVFDKNNDGFITAEELHIVLSKLGFVQGASSIAACKRMIQGVDLNGDGLVDFVEFKDMMLSRPSPRSYFASMIEVA